MAINPNHLGGRTEPYHGNRDMKLQDVFLNHCRREKIQVSIQLLDQSMKRGLIIGFDSQSIIVDEDGHQHLIYKSAVVAVNPQQQVNYIFNEAYRNEMSKGCPEYSADFS
jgi:host factor-I protein